jgi:1-phosphatidylinositol phosphodiesterase
VPSSRRTRLWVDNNTYLAMANITVSETDNYDWEDQRPDHNFQNVSIGPLGGRDQYEDLNTWASSAPFRMTIRFANGDEITFRADQWDATRSFQRQFGLGGPSANKYLMIQYAGGEVNYFTICRRVPLADWMAGLSGATRLSALTIPGTHDTCALHGGDAVQCQTKSLKDQLDSGIRYVDIRCRHIEDRFAIHHGAFYQDLMFGSGVRDVCVDWLRNHSRETIVMAIKHEYTDEKVTRSFEATFDWYLEGFERFWYLGDQTPTLDQARGKIVLLRRFEKDSSGPKGLDISQWEQHDNQTFTITSSGVTFHIQDEWKVYAWSMDDKAKKVYEQYKAAVYGKDTEWYINLTSGAAGLMPYTVAKGSPSQNGQNMCLLGNVVTSKMVLRGGVIAMDFFEYPDNTLAPKLVSLNDLR